MVALLLKCNVVGVARLGVGGLFGLAPCAGVRFGL